MKIKWLNEPEDHDYPAAVSYLSLIYKDYEVTRIVERLKQEKNIKLFRRFIPLPIIRNISSFLLPEFFCSCSLGYMILECQPICLNFSV